MLVFVTGRCGTYAYQVVTDSNGKTQLKIKWQNSTKAIGTSPIVAGNVLFVGRDTTIIAYDPTTGNVLWSSQRQSAGGTIGGMHWQGVIVVNGRVYAPDTAAYLNAYSL